MTSIKQKNRPEDLVSAVEAAKLVDRSKSSIRAWVRDKKLTGYRADPEKSNSSLMVSTQELIAFCAQNVAISGKPKGRTKTPSGSIEKLKEDKQKLEAEVNRLSLELKSLQADMAKLNTIMIKTEALSDSKERLISAHEATIAGSLHRTIVRCAKAKRHWLLRDRRDCAA